MNRKRTWLIVLITSAVAGSFSIQNTLRVDDEGNQTLPPTITETVTTVELPSGTPTALPAPTFDSTYGGCGFIWAYEDLPRLTEKFSGFVRALNLEATAHAQAFGENCVYSDGNYTFLAKETDYYVQLPVADLANEEVFGEWIAQVMPLIDQLPPEDIRGPQPGFVEFIFIKSETERIGLRVPIQQYKEIAPGKTAIELFRFYNIPPTSPT